MSAETKVGWAASIFLMEMAQGKQGDFTKILKGEGDLQTRVLPGVLQKTEQMRQDGAPRGRAG